MKIKIFFRTTDEPYFNFLNFNDLFEKINGPNISPFLLFWLVKMESFKHIFIYPSTYVSTYLPTQGCQGCLNFHSILVYSESHVYWNIRVIYPNINFYIEQFLKQLVSIFRQFESALQYKIPDKLIQPPLLYLRPVSHITRYPLPSQPLIRERSPFI